MDTLASVPRANDRTNSTRGLDFHRSLGSSTHGHDDTVFNDLTKFDNDSGISPFVEAIDKCNRRIEDLKEMALGERTGVKWFRAPHGRYTKEMEHGLEMRGMYNVMCDSYAVDPIVEQSTWIGQSLLRQSRDGSILLLHMPESGFREYCLDALAILLDGLSKRGMKVVTVTELESIATRRKGDRTEKK
jgi:peptidoglycan/xylan/chitin deacetylase (PgdA/CDA1 family)